MSSPVIAAMTRSIRRFAAAAAFLAAALLFVPTFAAAQERPAGLAPAAYALVGGTVRTAPGAEPFVGTVVVRDGLIVAVGPADAVAVPADARELDCDGLFLYAGFLDAATDRPLDDANVPDPTEGRSVNTSRYVLAATRTDNRKGLTPDFDAQNGLSDGDATTKAMDALRGAGFTAAHLVPRGKIAGGKTALVSTAKVPLRESLLAAGLFQAMDLSPMRGRDYPNTLMGTFAHIRQAFADAERLTLHKELWAENAPGVPRPPIDPALEGLADVLAGEIAPLFEVSTADDVRRALNFAAEYGLTPALAAGPRLREARTAWDPADENLAENAPEVIVLSLDFGDGAETGGLREAEG